MNLWNWKKKEVKLFEPPRMIQYSESNWPFYRKGVELINAAYAAEVDGKVFSYDTQYWWVGRDSNSHGRCSGGKKDCHHCQTIDAARDLVENVWGEWL